MSVCVQVAVGDKGREPFVFPATSKPKSSSGGVWKQVGQILFLSGLQTPLCGRQAKKSVSDGSACL